MMSSLFQQITLVQYHLRPLWISMQSGNTLKYFQRRARARAMTLDSVDILGNVPQLSEKLPVSTTQAMSLLYRGLQPVCSPLLHPKHLPRIYRTQSPAWTRPFHASANCRAIDLAYSLHDEHGKAKGAPIIIVHGLFGSKKNNRSVSK